MDDIVERLRSRNGYSHAYAPLADCVMRTEAADTILALRAQVLALEKDAARYRWLAPRLLAADFAWGDPAVTVLVFEWPSNVCVGSDCSMNIDAAIDSARMPPGEGT